MERFISFPRAIRPPKEIEAPSNIVMQAVGGGLWAVVASELDNGRGAELPELAQELSAFALVPFGVN
jgi:hypothetical protein